MRSVKVPFMTVLAGLSIYLTLAFASTTGQIKGRVTARDTGAPVVGASVLIVGTTQGAMTDLDGRFQILRVDSGTYTLRISSVEYTTVEITGVEVTIDATTEINQIMTQKSVTDLNKTITVEGRQDILDKFVVDSRMSINQETIIRRPAQTVDNLLEQVAGVRRAPNGEVHVRGGRAGEVAYIVDGIPLDGSANISLITGRATTGQQQPAPAHGGSAIVNGEPFDAMFFKPEGVNPFVDTEDDRFSTFAVDVDDASFIISRAYLERDELPPEEAVRTEEFINHFDYKYDSPVHDAFRVVMESAPSPFGPSNSWLLRIGIKGREILPENHKAANLVFVIDVSGSMAREDRLELVKKSLHLLLDQLTPADRVGIVVYGSVAQAVLEPISAVERGTIRHVIDDLHTSGATNAEHGIRLGYQMAERMYEPDKINRIVLCSDGVANVGVTGPDEILEIIKRYVDRGITLTSVGFGMGNYNDILMERLGNKGNGFYAYVDDLDEARRLFERNAVATLEVIARDVKIQVDFNPATVRSYRLLGYENRDVADEKFRDDTEDGGEIGAGHTCTALYEMKLVDQPSSDLAATVFIRHKDPGTGEVDEINHPFYLSARTGGFESASDDFRLAAAAAELAEILRGSYWAKGSSLNDVMKIARGIPSTAADGTAVELVEMVRAANSHSDALAKR
jgi:Ca-activated chloride channel family protein